MSEMDCVDPRGIPKHRSRCWTHLPAHEKKGHPHRGEPETNNRFVPNLDRVVSSIVRLSLRGRPEFQRTTERASLDVWPSIFGSKHEKATAGSRSMQRNKEVAHPRGTILELFLTNSCQPYHRLSFLLGDSLHLDSRQNILYGVHPQNNCGNANRKSVVKARPEAHGLGITTCLPFGSVTMLPDSFELPT